MGAPVGIFLIGLGYWVNVFSKGSVVLDLGCGRGGTGFLYTFLGIISTKFLGYIYNATFNNITKDNFKYIENIYYKGLKITIDKIFITNENSINIYNFALLLPVSTINTSDIFEIINENILLTVTVNIINDPLGKYKCNLNFLNKLYTPDNTYIEINKVKHSLFYEDSIYFIKTSTNIFLNIVSKLNHIVYIYMPIKLLIYKN